MIFTSILILIVAIALPSSSWLLLALNFILGISTILCIFTEVLFALLVTFYIQSIGSSKGIDSWWFKKNGLNFRYNLLNLLIWICL